jgi:hypothetical protein
MLRRACSKAAVPLLFLLGAVTGASADSRLDVKYLASLTGIPVGRGSFILDISDNGYAVAGSAKVAGLAKLVSRGQGSTASRGTFVAGKVSPATYSTSSESDKKSEEIRMSLENNTVKEYSVSPPQAPSPDRLPVTEEHRTGIVDPMSAAIISVPGTGDMVSKENCSRTVAIFDGKQRYDLLFHFEKIEQVKDVKGYSGPMLVCRVDYKAVAGHRPDRIQVKFMEANKSIYVGLAPVAGTRVLFPIRVSFMTMIGIVTVEAESFAVAPREKQVANPAGK